MTFVRRKRTLSMLLAAMLAAGALAGCGNSEKSTGTPVDGSNSTTGNASSNGESQSSEAERDLYEFTLLGNLATELNELDKAYFKGLEDALNLKINIELPPGSAYEERLQMMVASGEYADVTLFPSHTMTTYVDACRDGVFIRLNEMLEKCPNLMAHTYEISWETLKILSEEGDDSIFSVPRTSIARADGFDIRADWLENVGITDFVEGKPVTLDQMTEILRKFTFDDPDGNGIDDTFGLGVYGSGEGNMDVFFGATFGLGGWGNYDGEIIDLKYSRNHDNYKRALQYAQDIWKEGLVDPDAPTIKNDVALERFKKGVTGVRGEFAGWMTQYERQAQEVNPEARYCYATSVVEKEGGSYSAGGFNTGFWGQWAIANSAEKPERILEMFDYMLSDEYWNDTNYGPKGIAWTEVDGVITPTDQDEQVLASRNILRRNDDPGFFVSLDLDEKERDRIEGLIDICIDQYIFSLDMGYRPPVADDPTFIDYGKNMAIQISKIVVGELPVSEWDLILDGWYEAGGQTYVEQMQTYIQSIS